MFVIQVIPLIRGTQLESLSYFSSQTYPIGSFIEVPIRGKQQRAIVTENKPVSSTKTALKAATFSLRKLPTQPDPVVLPESLLKTAQELTRQYPTSIGAILHSLLPPDIRNGSKPYPRSDTSVTNEETTPQLLTARTDERYDTYQSLIRSTLAHRGSILIVLPTATEIEYAVQKLSHGIEDRLVVFSSNQTARQRDTSYRKLADTTAAKLVITTPSHAYLERVDLMAIVIEQAASNNYITRQRPYLDHRDALMTYARVSKRSILLGDTVPRTEDEARRRDEQFTTYGEAVKRITFPSPLSVIIQKDKPKIDTPFQLFSKQLLSAVERALEARGHVFLYAARRGLSPVVVCIDCGHIFRCPDSNTPYSLIRTKKNNEEERWFVSSTSGRRVKAADVCVDCGSWRLRERGIGIQHIYDEWKSTMPDTDVMVMDNTTAKTPKQASGIAQQFFAKKSGVLIGTQLALPFLTQGVAVSAIISLDATRTIPTWRADESLFRILLRLRECTQKEVLIQSRTETDNLITYAARGAIERFYDDEIALRKLLQYPPFSIFVLLTWAGTTTSVLTIEENIAKSLIAFPVQFYNNPNSTPEKTHRHGLIRVPITDHKQLENVLDKIRILPPYVKVEINPERIV